MKLALNRLAFQEFRASGPPRGVFPAAAEMYIDCFNDIIINLNDFSRTGMAT